MFYCADQGQGEIIAWPLNARCQVIKIRPSSCGMVARKCYPERAEWEPNEGKETTVISREELLPQHKAPMLPRACACSLNDVATSVAHEIRREGLASVNGADQRGSRKANGLGCSIIRPWSPELGEASIVPHHHR